MSRCVIFCAGERGDTGFSPSAGDFVICCDAGYKAAEEMGVRPDLLLGDFDSYGGELPRGVETLRYPVEKDDTDSMLAVREGLRRGYADFVLLFSLGGRLDHTVANIQTLEFLRQNGAAGMLIGPRDTVRLLKDGSLTLKRREGYTLSVFAFGGPARGVSLSGVQYPLDNGELTAGFPLGLGNHITGESASVTVADGTLLVMESQIN